MSVLSMDDKLLGEKVNYYCSSSEEEDDDSPVPEASMNNRPFRTGKSTAQTGPKGVLEDWKNYKRLEYEEKERNAAKRDELIKKLAFSCGPKSGTEDDVDDEDKEFLEMYNKKRMLELQQKFASRWTGITFGKLTELTAQNYVEEIENEKRCVTIIIHIYDDNIDACEAMTGCFHVLAKEYRSVKFCQIKASEARLSQNFLDNGLPTLLAYKNNTLLGSFVHVSDSLGEDFYASDVEAFLKSYSVLPDKDISEDGSCSGSSDDE